MSSTKYGTMSGRLSISEERQSYLKRLGYPELHSSNFLDLDLLSSSGNSCDEETYDRYYIWVSFLFCDIHPLDLPITANDVPHLS
jgi:hypothetical protein